MKPTRLMACGLALLPVVALAAPEQASIPFATTTGIETWQAQGNDTLYIKSRNDRWYKADLFAPCVGLGFDPAIGFVVKFGSSFDSTSSILVDGRECQVSSLVEVSGPPRKQDAPTKEGGAAGTTGAPAESRASASAGEAGVGARPADRTTGKSRAVQAPSARIPFADLGGIRDWRAVSDELLYVQGRDRQWYRARLFAPCTGLTFENAIGFAVEPTGSFDRFSSIVVDGRECPLASLTKSEAPPSRRASAKD